MQYLLITTGAIVRNIMLVAVVLIAALAVAGAQSLNSTQFTPSTGSGLNAYLSNYISNSTISSSTFFGNQSLNGKSYIIMQLPGTNNYIIIENQSGSYTMQTNATIISKVLTPFLIGKYYPSKSQIDYLNSTMESYKRYGYANLTDCLYETGIASGTTCTLANNCLSCTQIPVCSKALNANGGPNSTFGLGISNFSSNYTVLNNSYNNYFLLLGRINRTNAGTIISELSSIVSNITSVSQKLPNNPIFPPTQNVYSCGNYIALPPNKQPWYCVAVGFCGAVSFNSTQLSDIQSNLTMLGINLPSATSISVISSNSSTAAEGYISAALQNQNGAAYRSLINAYYPKYNATVAKADALLLKYNNVTLNASLHVLTTEFRALQRLGVNQSIGVANTILGSLIANTTRIYSNASASYSQLYGISRNNTAALIADQLNYQQVPSQLAQLADMQQNINVKLNSVIPSNGISGAITPAQSIRVESSVFVAPLTIGYVTKTLDTPFINGILGSATSPAPRLISSAPSYAAIASLIIGILIIVIILVLFYLKVVKKGKLKGNKKKQRMWIAIFAILAILVIIYTYATYVYASNANNFLPFNYFTNTLKASTSAYIALNGSAGSNLSIIACANTIQSYLTGAGKSVQIIRLTNYSCLSGSNISVLGLNCYNSILSQDKPVIFLSQSRQSSIVYKGLYGAVLYASGNSTLGSSCLLSTLLRN